MAEEQKPEQKPESIGLGPTHVLTAMQMRRVIDPESGPALEMELRDDVVNPHGSLHGGLMGALIECGAAGCAVRAGGGSASATTISS